MSSSGQEVYFNNRIKKLQDQLHISYDLSFLLLNAYEWDEAKIIELITNSPKETLENVGLHLETESFPTLESPITAKVGEKEECPICCSESELLHLYCGHKLCKECFIVNISMQLKEQIHFPTCPYKDSHKNRTLILPSDIQEYITEPALLEKYQKIFINTCSLNCKGIKKCDYCDHIIQEKTEFSCHTYQCPKCHYAYCSKCYNGCHAPLYDCVRVKQFIHQGHYDILLLKKEQEQWIKRELRLHDYRLDHRDEYNAYFDQQIENCKKILSEESKEKSDEISQINSDIESLKTKKGSLSDPEEVQAIEKLIQKEEEIKEELVRQERLDSQNRTKFIEYIADLKEHYYNAFIYEKEDRHDFFVCQFKEFIDGLFIELDCDSDKRYGDNTIVNCPRCGTPISPHGGCIHMTCAVCRQEFCRFCSKPWEPDHKDFYTCPFTHEEIGRKQQKSEDDFDLPKNCKQCPSCHSAVMKAGGSNVMICSRCKHCFCWECLGPWDQSHNNHFGCPSMKKYDKKEIEDKNDIDPNDMSFHPMPISPEKVIEFAKWSRLANLHQQNMDEIDTVKNPYAQKIVQLLKNDELAAKYNNDIKFGKSIIAWSYAELFYIEKDAAKLAVMVHLLKALVDNLVDSIENPWMKNPSSYFNHNIELLYLRINNILNFVQSVNK